MTPQKDRLRMIKSIPKDLSISDQCDLLEVSRSSFYYSPVAESQLNLELMRKIDKQYFKTPFYGVLRLTAWLQSQGYLVNEKRIRRLMKKINWRTIYREPRTTISDKTHYKYPYLLRDLIVERPNQVWAMDITYIPMEKGFMYLSAIIDLHSRYIVHWSISNTMSAEWCTEVVKYAIEKYGKPEIFNTDQGSQFTSEIFINQLKINEIKISMDGKGRALDNIFIERFWRNVKYENVYLNVYENGLDLYKGLDAYFKFYNSERLHQSLGYLTPERVYLKVA